jgi:hypothetical protein
MTIDGKNRSAHRVSYETFRGPIPVGAFVRHSCDNPACINPAHLQPGTAAENSRDMVARRRSKLGFTRPGTGPSGELNGKAKLCRDSVCDIRRQAESGVTPTKLAAQHGVTVAAVCKVIKRQTWKDV